jgi:hypothetical protein
MATKNTMAMAVVLALTLSTAAGAATIVVNSLADPGAKGICALRDAITAANTKTATNGCTAGTGKDTIRFSVTGTITLASTLPQITDSRLTINGPTSPGITIDGGSKGLGTGVQVMQVASGATLELRNLTIAHGFAEPKGGGIFNQGTLLVVNSTFSNNTAFQGSSPGLFSCQGGAIYNNGTLTVTDSSFTGNATQENTPDSSLGGAISNAGTLRVVKSTFSDNRAFGGVSSTGNGGGIYNNGTLTVTKSTFSDNDAPGNGGGISNSGVLTVRDSIFSGNFTGIFGGGGISNDGTLTVTNSTFSDNTSGMGGGISNDVALVVTNCTFSGNNGGAIVNGDFASLKNTILASSSGGRGNCSGTIIDTGYNISDDNSCKFSATSSRNNTNPMLDPKGLQHNGGPTETIALDSESPAIDAIPFTDCTDQALQRIITDQRGALRPDAGELRCDIGAFEFQDFAGRPNCYGMSVSALARRFDGLERAAWVLGFLNVRALLKAIQISCGG